MPLRFKRFERIRSHFAFRVTQAGCHRVGDDPRRGDRGDADDRSGPWSARSRGARGIEARRPDDATSARLGVRLFNGKFVIEDFVIEGLVPTDRPFLTAKRIDVSLAWEAMFRREVLVDSIVMSDWHMVLEQWAGGKHSFPKFNMGGGSRSEAIRHDDAVRAHAGTARSPSRITDRDGVRSRATSTSSSASAPAITVKRRFHGGTVWIQDYVPMSMSMKALFHVDDGNVHFDRMTPDSPTAPNRTSRVTPTFRTGPR